MRKQRTPRAWKANVYGETKDARNGSFIRERGVTRYVREARKRAGDSPIKPVSELVKRANEILILHGERKLTKLY